MKKLVYIIFNIIIIISANAQIINRNPGFEDGTWQNEWRDSNSTPVTDSNRGIELVTSPTRNGTRALKFFHKDFYRCEIVSSTYNYNGEDIIAGQFEFFKEYWVGVSFYLKDWNTNPSTWNTLLQTHTVPYNGDWSCGSGNNGMSVQTKYNSNDGSRLEVHAAIVENPMTAISESSGVGPIAWSIPCPENQWVDFVFNFKYSYNNDGYIKVWYNGDLIVDISGPNVHYLDRCGRPRMPITNFKLGSYKERTTSNYREMYVDEVRIGNANASYSDVAPSGQTPENLPPILSSIGSKNIIEGNSIDVPLSASDPDGDNLNFSVSPNYDFVNLTDNNNGTGNLRISPQVGDAGNYNITVTVTDSNGDSDSESINLYVENVAQENSPPVLSSIGDQSITEGSVLNIHLNTSDADGDALSYSTSPNLEFVTLIDNNDGTGTLLLAPNSSHDGTYNLTVIVTDSKSETDSETISINVVDVPGNILPTLGSIGDQTVTEESTTSVQLVANDADGDALSYSITPNYSFITLVDNLDGTGNIDIAPTSSDIGTYNLTVMVTDQNNGSDIETIVIRVVNNVQNNNAPVLSSIGDHRVAEGNILNIPLNATDLDGDNLTYTLTPSLGFVTLSDNNDGTGMIIVDPVAGNIGVNHITVKVTDPNNASDSETITVIVDRVENGNTIPILFPIGDQRVDEGEVRNVSLSASDADEDNLNFSVSSNLTFVTLEDNLDGTGNLSIAPSSGDAGVYNISVQVSDNNGGTFTRSLTLYIADTQGNLPPILSNIGNHSITEGNILDIQVSCSDPDGDNMSLSVSPNLSFITLTNDQNGEGSLRIAPVTGDAGSYSITVTVTDSRNGTDSETLNISVTELIPENSNPVLATIGNQRVSEGSTLSINLSASDVDGDALSYSITPNLDFITLADNQDGTGTITFLPSIGDAGTYSLIVTVTDQQNGNDLESILLIVDQVEEGNTLPYLNKIEDQIVIIGNIIDIELLANDVDGDDLSYSFSPELDFITLIDNNDGSGLLRVSPQTDDVGKYTMVVTVGDINNGKTSESFTLIVNNEDSEYANFINSGGTSVAYGSMLAQEDKYYTGGNSAERSESFRISGTEEEEVYRSVRYGDFTYNIPVPRSGMYTVRLHFSEVTFNDGEIGRRVFSTYIENRQQELINYDINADVGPMTATIKTFSDILVEDGSLTIDLETVVRNAIISGIEVINETDNITHLDSESDLVQLKIYPNPSEGRFIVELASNKTNNDIPILIYNIAGKIVYKSSIKEYKKEIDLSSAKKGMYILKIGDFEAEKLFLY